MGEQQFPTAVDCVEFGSFPLVLGDKINAIHPELAWETSRGIEAARRLTVTAAGMHRRYPRIIPMRAINA